MTDVRSHPDSLANLHCHLVTALHMNVRELSQHCTAALSFRKIHMRYAILLQSATWLDTLEKITQPNDPTIDVKHTQNNKTRIRVQAEWYLYVSTDFISIITRSY